VPREVQINKFQRSAELLSHNYNRGVMKIDEGATAKTFIFDRWTLFQGGNDGRYMISVKYRKLTHAQN
jgi:hypothetical protein